MILICHDGSDNAKAAIEQAGRLFHGQKVVVLTVWQPFNVIAVHTPTAFGFLPTVPDVEEIDRASERYARAQAEAGAELARKADLEAEPLTRRVVTTTAEAILDEAEAQDASAILLGSRGLTGLRSRLLGSVSNVVVHHSDRPVIVVPSPSVALQRARSRADCAAESQSTERV